MNATLCGLRASRLARTAVRGCLGAVEVRGCSAAESEPQQTAPLQSTHPQTDPLAVDPPGPAQTDPLPDPAAALGRPPQNPRQLQHESRRANGVGTLAAVERLLLHLKQRLNRLGR